MPHTIILAHGVLGFGSLTDFPGPIEYFNGVAGHLRNHGHEVFAPQVNPIGSVIEHGQQLADFIQQNVPSGRKVHVIAHSMGGLDARHAITNIFKEPMPIVTLATIGTPHLGSPVADAIFEGSGPIFDEIPKWIRTQLGQKTPALQDLTTKVCQRFDLATQDIEGVDYFEIAGDARKAKHELFLFSLAAAIGRIADPVNDGVVTKLSALRQRTDGKTSRLTPAQQVSDWPTDHAGEVGWTPAWPLPILLQPPDILAPPHYALYDQLIAKFRL
jgi:triacylglycerol lipase